jgi:dUTP pyrophosphatase
MISLKVKRVDNNATLPIRATPGAAGYDLSSSECITVPAYGKALVPTGLMIAVPSGTYGRIAPRSSLAWKNHIDVGAGVIDADYRGKVGVVLFNHSDVDFIIKIGDRIAQLIIQKIETPEVEEMDNLDDTERGKGGFGSTGQTCDVIPQRSQVSGASALTVYDYMTTGSPQEINNPYDVDDYSRIKKLLDKCPSWRKRIYEMKKLSTEWNALISIWDDIERLYNEEGGKVWRGSCDNLIRAVLD